MATLFKEITRERKKPEKVTIPEISRQKTKKKTSYKKEKHMTLHFLIALQSRGHYMASVSEYLLSRKPKKKSPFLRFLIKTCRKKVYIILQCAGGEDVRCISECWCLIFRTLPFPLPLKRYFLHGKQKSQERVTRHSPSGN